MIRKGKKYYDDIENGYTSIPGDLIKKGDIVVFDKDYPSKFKKGEMTRIIKVNVVETGQNLIDYVLVDDGSKEGWMVSIRLLKKATFIQQKDYELQKRLDRRARNIGKSF